MEENTLIWLVALVGAIPGIIALIIQLLKVKKQNKKMESDITAQITKAASTMLGHMKEQIKDLEEDVKILKCELIENKIEIIRLIKGINRLIAQIRGLDHVPVWTPDSDDEKYSDFKR